MGTTAFQHLHVTKYQPSAGSTLHFVNRVVLTDGDEPSEMLLVRLRHPSARTRVGSARWLLVQAQFNKLIGRVAP